MAAVSNAGPLIHLAKIGRLSLLGEIFSEVIIPKAVKIEVVDRGKDKGMPDAFLIDNVQWIRVVDDPPNSELLAEKVGIHRGEASAILLAKSLRFPILLDDSDARRFASGLGLQVVGSIGVLIRAVKTGLISREDGIKSLERLAETMWLSADVYMNARKVMEGFKLFYL
ncbi:hypothetical protein DRP07_07805 [Archaeoglobales archaeon]|nr:MAG: hypothetical protein DRP07_07805 [Archaeoglobales archaeon]